MIDLLLVNPPENKPILPVEHLGLGYLAGAARQAGLTVEIIDAPVDRLGYKALTDAISERKFSVLGVSVLFQENLMPVLEWLKAFRAAGLRAHITLGGHPPTFTFREILTAYNCVDSIVRGEGELTIVELVRKVIGDEDWRSTDGIAYRLDEMVKINASRPLISDLNSLAWPARDTIRSHPLAFEHLVVSASRGCHGNCSFCSIATFYRSFKGKVWRRREPDDVLDEIEAALSVAPMDHVLLFDDTFIGPGRVGREQAFEFAQALARRRPKYVVGTSCRADQVDEELFRALKKAGFRQIFLGIESGNEDSLRLFDKRSSIETNHRALAILKKLGFAVEIGFIMFNPYTTFSQIRQDLDFLMASGCGPDIRNLGKLGLFPGEPLVSKLSHDGLLRGSPFNYEADFADKRVGSFLKAIQNDLFDKTTFSTLSTLDKMSKAVVLGDLPPSVAVKKVESSISKTRQALHDLLYAGSKVFEQSGGPPDKKIADLKMGFASKVSGFFEALR